MRKFDPLLFSESGSVLVQVLMASLVLGIISVSLTGYYGRQTAQQSSRRISNELQNLNSLVTMIFSNPTMCRGNLTSQLIGSSLSDLNDQREAALQFPAPSNAILAANSNFSHMTIQKVSFSQPVQIRPPDASYLSEMTIDVKDPASPGAFQRLIVPFYFLTSGAALTDCFATTYPEPQPATGKQTMEDNLCLQWQRTMYGNQPIPAAEQFIYAPAIRTCVPAGT